MPGLIKCISVPLFFVFCMVFGISAEGSNVRKDTFFVLEGLDSSDVVLSAKLKNGMYIHFNWNTFYSFLKEDVDSNMITDLHKLIEKKSKKGRPVNLNRILQRRVLDGVIIENYFEDILENRHCKIVDKNGTEFKEITGKYERFETKRFYFSVYEYRAGDKVILSFEIMSGLLAN